MTYRYLASDGLEDAGSATGEHGFASRDKNPLNVDAESFEATQNGRFTAGLQLAEKADSAVLGNAEGGLAARACQNFVHPGTSCPLFGPQFSIKGLGRRMDPFHPLPKVIIHPHIMGRLILIKGQLRRSRRWM
eukprot:scaffold62818_cov39-Attheya_sp.AAC.1